MHIGELHMRLGVDHEVMWAELETMMARGEVVRLHPIDYPGEDHDFFRLSGQGSPRAAVAHGSGSRGLRKWRHHVRLAANSMAVWPTNAILT